MSETRIEATLDRYLAGEVAQTWAPRLEALAPTFSARGAETDREGRVPAENVEALVESGYTALTVPFEAGGVGATLADMCALQVLLGMADGSTALGIGWHLSLILGVRATDAWPDEVRARVYADTVHKGALINSCATERETGSPSRGGRPTTQARAADGGYRLNGRKTFATFSPLLHWYLVTASLEDGSIGEFLVEAGTPGVRVEETWDSLSMRASGSHDLVLEDAPVPDALLVDRFTPPARSVRSADAGGPLLHVPACYLGVAYAARRDVLRFAWQHRPNSLPGPIAELPSIEDQIGTMEIALAQATALLFDVASAWDRADTAGRQRLRGPLAAAKVAATEAAVSVTDRCMRIVGGLSLSRRLPFERYFRDARAGLHNPPLGDLAVRALGKAALAQAKE